MLLGDSQVVCKASTMGCMPADPSGGYSGGVGTLGIHRNLILGTIWHRTFGPPGGCRCVFGRLGPLAPRLLTATPGSFTCGDDHCIPTEASESTYPHAHGHGDVFAMRWQPLANSQNGATRRTVWGRRALLQLPRNRLPLPETASHTSPMAWTSTAHQAAMNPPSHKGRLNGSLACKRLSAIDLEEV